MGALQWENELRPPTAYRHLRKSRKLCPVASELSCCCLPLGIAVCADNFGLELLPVPGWETKNDRDHWKNPLGMSASALASRLERQIHEWALLPCL